MSGQIEDVVSSKVVALLQVFQNASAFVIPAYQRSYSWDKEQVRKLIGDMYTGLCSLGTSATPNEEYRFLGTIITVEKSGTFVNYGLNTPNQFQEIVDGQQRITTLALIGLQLEKMIYAQLNLVLNDSTYANEHEEVKSIVDEYCKNLQMLYMTTSQNSRIKMPRIIREEIDLWQEGGYKSALSNVVMKYIYEDRYRINYNVHNDLVVKNIQEISNLLECIRTGSKTFNTDNGESSVDEFVLDIQRILTSFPKRILWDRQNCQFDRKAIDEHDKNTPLNRLVRLLLFAFYLKNKCVINYISAKKEDWAFDMFVSLNTTGVPLTAVETFRANLLVHVKSLNLSSELKNNLNRQIIDLYTNSKYGVQSYFDKEPDTEKKTKKTKEFVTTFALAYDGTKLGYDLHRQRIWLRDSLNHSMREVSHKSSRERSESIQVYMSRIRNMLKFMTMRDTLISKEIQVIDDLQSTPNSDLAMLCLCFLDDVNHSIVNALLSRFYERLQSKKDGVQRDFVDSVLAVTAFFVLWRSVRGTSGLPEVYREGMAQFFAFRANSEGAEFQLNINDVKRYLRGKLASYVDSKNLLDKTIWVATAERELRFRGMKDLCRFIIFISLNNTTKDINNPGLIVSAMNGFANWADQDNWHSTHYATIEHIAPQNPGQNSDWDTKLYDERDLFDRIGNLALLPTSINSAVGNNSWSSKWIYYSHLAEANPQNLAKLNDLAKTSGLLLKSRTIKLLRNAQFNYHMDPIVAVGIDGTWNADLVERRTKRMLEIFHDRMMQWLKVEE